MITVHGYGSRMRLRRTMKRSRRRETGRPAAEQLTPRQERLFLDHVSRAERLARALHAQKIGFAEQTDDLESYAFQGLLDAVREYDCTMNDSFWGFAAQRVHGAIIDGLRRTKVLMRGERLKQGAQPIQTFSLHALIGEDRAFIDELQAEPQDHDQRIDDERLLARALAVMTDQERELVRLRFVEELTWREIGLQTGMNPKDAHRRTEDALQRARNIK